METVLKVYNSLSRKIEKFEAVNPPNVGLYVCGPTVYGDAHLGHSRPSITFDILLRWLRSSGYKVRYVSNITDVGHLEDEVNEEGEDKILKKARIEQLEPMEVVQYYTNRYRDSMRKLNVIPPSIEPLASGHIIEQIRMTKEILDNGYAYEVNGSVYFDVPKYNADHHYGILSGRVVEELEESGRALEGTDEKRNRADFALWKKAAPEHLMKWESPWSIGFPGWHLECSVMSGKYLGVPFDIHGGGMDLKFPHHECEIAQSVASTGTAPVKYWMHNNMITINGQKMSKSLGNFITLDQMFSGEHDVLEQAYSPMTIRFFILQTHYRSTVDFSNDALQAAEKGLSRLLNAKKILSKIAHPGGEAKVLAENEEVIKHMADVTQFMNDDLSTPQALASLFELSTKINSWYHGSLNPSDVSESTFKELLAFFPSFIEDILGLVEESTEDTAVLDGLMQLIIDMRLNARENKDWATSDKIRDDLASVGIQVKDEKDGRSSWTKNN